MGSRIYPSLLGTGIISTYHHAQFCFVLFFFFFHRIWGSISCLSACRAFTLSAELLFQPLFHVFEFHLVGLVEDCDFNINSHTIQIQLGCPMSFLGIVPNIVTSFHLNPLENGKILLCFLAKNHLNLEILWEDMGKKSARHMNLLFLFQVLRLFLLMVDNK